MVCKPSFTIHARSEEMLTSLATSAGNSLRFYFSRVTKVLLWRKKATRGLLNTPMNHRASNNSSCPRLTSVRPFWGGPLFKAAQDGTRVSKNYAVTKRAHERSKHGPWTCCESPGRLGCSILSSGSVFLHLFAGTKSRVALLTTKAALVGFSAWPFLRASPV